MRVRMVDEIIPPIIGTAIRRITSEVFAEWQLVDTKVTTR